jgi:hypothetical protein
MFTLLSFRWNKFSLDAFDFSGEEQLEAGVKQSLLSKKSLHSKWAFHRFRVLMERLSKKNGWSVRVTTILDYLLEKKR